MNLRQRLREHPWQSCLYAHTILMLLILYLPLAVLLVYSFNAGPLALRWEGFSWRWYRETLAKPDVLQAIINSISIAVVSGSLSALLGTGLALAIERGTRRLRTVSRWFGYVSLLIPEIVLAIGLLILFNQFLRPALLYFNIHINSFVAVVIGHISIAMAYVMITVRARLQEYNSTTELAALDLGATYPEVLQRIILPQISPAIFSGGLLAIALSLDDFYVSYFVTVGGSGFKTVPLHIWALQGRNALTPEINCVSVIMLMLSLGLLTLAYVIKTYGQKQQGAVYE